MRNVSVYTLSRQLCEPLGDERQDSEACCRDLKKTEGPWLIHRGMASVCAMLSVNLHS